MGPHYLYTRGFTCQFVQSIHFSFRLYYLFYSIVFSSKAFDLATKQIFMMVNSSTQYFRHQEHASGVTTLV